MTICIALTRGQFALIDNEDESLVSGYCWHAHPVQRRSGGFYASSRVKGALNTTVYMHRIILGAEPGMLVDHINGNGLDNRRCNLRIATKSQNLINRAYKTAHGFRGIERTPQGNWRARVTSQKQTFRSKRFESPVDAAAAYDDLARLHHGDFALLNFPGTAA